MGGLPSFNLFYSKISACRGCYPDPPQRAAYIDVLGTSESIPVDVTINYHSQFTKSGGQDFKSFGGHYATHNALFSQT